MKPVMTNEERARQIAQSLETVDRWIESLQILAGDVDNPTESQRLGMERVRVQMLNLFAHAQAERIRLHIAKRWPREFTSGETAADLVDPYVPPS